MLHFIHSPPWTGEPAGLPHRTARSLFTRLPARVSVQLVVCVVYSASATVSVLLCKRISPWLLLGYRLASPSQ